MMTRLKFNVSCLCHTPDKAAFLYGSRLVPDSIMAERSFPSYCQRLWSGYALQTSRRAAPLGYLRSFPTILPHKVFFFQRPSWDLALAGDAYGI